jgi:hypothetical protein
MLDETKLNTIWARHKAGTLLAANIGIIDISDHQVIQTVDELWWRNPGNQRWRRG